MGITLYEGNSESFTSTLKKLVFVEIYSDI